MAPATEAVVRHRTREVLALVDAFSARSARTVRQRRMLGRALAGLHRMADAEPLLPCIHLPLLIHGGLAGDHGPAVPLAAATAMHYRGAHLADDAADGDPPEEWADSTPEEQSLAAMLLCAALPPLLIAELEAPAEVRADIQEAFGRGTLGMAAGQADDMAATGRPDVAPEEVERSAAEKNGAQLALFAEAAARLAGASPETVAWSAALGRALGAARQLASDCYELYHDPEARDLARGTRTLPIVLHLERLEGTERAHFLRLLDAARTDDAARRDVRRRIRDGATLRGCAFIIETYCQRALRLLDELDLDAPSRDTLRLMIEQASLSVAA